MDEDRLEELLQEKVGYARASTRIYDLKSLSAVHRLRKGAVTTSIETTRCIFITDNFRVVSAGYSIGNEEGHRVPLAMTEMDIAALIWVRSPLVADDLPREQLLAAVHAGMQPSANLWLRYLAEVDELRSRDEISDDEAIALRTEDTALNSLMDVTFGQSQDLNKEAVTEVVDRLRSTLSEPARKELQAAEAERERVAAEKDDVVHQVRSLKDRVEEFEVGRTAQVKGIDDHALKNATQIVSSLTAVWVSLLVLLFVLSDGAVDRLPWDFPTFVRGFIAVVTAMSIAVGSGLARLPRVDLRKRCIARLSARLARIRRERLGLTGE